MPSLETLSFICLLQVQHDADGSNSDNIPVEGEEHEHCAGTESEVAQLGPG